MFEEIWKWATTEPLGVTIFGGTIVAIIVGVWVVFKNFIFKPKPQNETSKIEQTATGRKATQVAGERAAVVQAPQGNSIVNTGDSATTIINGVPHEDHAQLAKQLGITEERLNSLTRILEDAGIPWHEASVRIPKMMARLKTLAEQLDGAPKVGGRTDDLRQKAEDALEDADFDAADDWLRQAEEQDGQAQHQLTDEAQERARAAAASALARAELAKARFKYPDAARHFLRAADYYPDQDHRERIEALNLAGRAFREAADFAQAEATYTRAQTLAETTLGNTDPLIATVLNNLAALFLATNRLDQAEPLMERVVSIFEKTFGVDHPKVATALNNLAGLYRATNRLGQAEPLTERALAIDERTFGPDHPEVATDLNNLAALYRDTNRLDLAEPLYKRALGIFTASLGAEHPKTKNVEKNLAILRAKIAKRGDGT